MAGLTYNDTSNKQGLLQDCEFLLNLGDSGITGDVSTQALPKVFLRLINSWYQKVVTMIFSSQDEWTWDDSNTTDYPIATANLVANQQDYAIPVSLNALKIQRVDISFDSGTTWHKAEAFNKNETGNPLDATSIAGNFSTDKPYYSIENNALWTFPIAGANSTAGLKIWFQRGPLEFASTDTTKQPGIDPAFHRMLSIGAAYEFAITKNLPQRDVLSGMLQDYEMRLKQYYGRKDEDRNWALKSGISNDIYN